MITGGLRHRNIRPLWAAWNRHTSRPATNGSQDNQDDDFFGIKYLTGDDVRGTLKIPDEIKTRLDQRVEKYLTLSRLKETPHGFMHTTTFGAVRYDRDNRVEFMGQFDETSEYSAIEVKRNLLLSDGSFTREKVGVSGNNVPQDDMQREETSLNIVEEQYFGGTTFENEVTEEPAKEEDKNDLNYIDYQYFKEKYAPDSTPEGIPSEPIKFRFTPYWEEYQKILDDHDRIQTMEEPTDRCGIPGFLEDSTFARDSPLKSLQDVSRELSLLKQQQYGSKDMYEKAQEDKEKNEDHLDAKEAIDATGYVKPEPAKTALEYVTQLRSRKIEPEDMKYLKRVDQQHKKRGRSFDFRKIDQGEERFDSHGKRNYQGQIPDLNLMRREELVEYLRQRILLNERDIVAIDKPYGLVVEGGKGNKKYPMLEDLLPDLSKAIFKEEGQLHLVHRLDRDTTGVLLLARSLSMVTTLRDLLARQLISKYYWAITRGIPDPKVGIIDIPLELSKIDGKERMVLRPECDDDFNRQMGMTKGPRIATTHYRVLREAGNAGFVEVRPEQGIRHQIRAHLGLALRTPILGDHKYSNVDKIVPQTLPNDMMFKLNVRKSKVRTIPMHLHARMYILPGLSVTGGNLYVTAHLPGYFRANMSRLGLTSANSVIKTPMAF